MVTRESGSKWRLREGRTVYDHGPGSVCTVVRWLPGRAHIIRWDDTGEEQSHFGMADRIWEPVEESTPW